MKTTMETADARVAMRKYRRNATRLGARGSEAKTDIDNVCIIQYIMVSCTVKHCRYVETRPCGPVDGFGPL